MNLLLGGGKWRGGQTREAQLKHQTLIGTRPQQGRSFWIRVMVCHGGSVSGSGKVKNYRARDRILTDFEIPDGHSVTPSRAYDDYCKFTSYIYPAPAMNAGALCRIKSRERFKGRLRRSHLPAAHPPSVDGQTNLYRHSGASPALWWNAGRGARVPHVMVHVRAFARHP